MHHCSVIKYVDFLFDLPGHHTEAWVELYICYGTLNRRLNLLLQKNFRTFKPLIYPILNKQYLMFSCENSRTPAILSSPEV